MSSSDKIPPVLGSPSAPDAAGVAAEVAATAGATEASAPDAVVADVAAASGVVDGAAPTVAAPKVAAGGRYSDAEVAAMTEGQLWTAVSAGLLTSGQMTRALQQFGLEAKTTKGYKALLLQQALARSSGPASLPNAQETAEAAAADDEAAQVKVQEETADCCRKLFSLDFW